MFFQPQFTTTQLNNYSMNERELDDILIPVLPGTHSGRGLGLKKIQNPNLWKQVTFL